MQDPIAGPSTIDQREAVSRKMEDTNSYWLRVIVYIALIGHVDVVQILHHSTPLSYTPAWRRYIFALVIGRSGWDLKMINEH